VERGKSPVERLASAVNWIEDEIEKLRGVTKRYSRELLELADKLASELEVEANRVLERILAELREELGSISRNLEEEHKDRLSKILDEIRKKAEKNFDDAVDEVVKAIIRLVEGAKT